jgi:hypothetical protein
VRGGELQHEQHQREQAEDQLQRRHRAAPVGQSAAPQVARRHRHAVDQQHQAHRIGREAADLLQDRRQEGEGGKRRRSPPRSSHRPAAGAAGEHRHLLAQRGRRRGASRGTNSRLPTKASTPSADTARKVSRQPKCWPMKVPSGTPVTSATVRPVNMMAIALAALSLGTTLVAMIEPIEKNTPCARPVSTRATISVP